jgi:hypothetical protein
MDGDTWFSCFLLQKIAFKVLTTASIASKKQASGHPLNRHLFCDHFLYSNSMLYILTVSPSFMPISSSR